MTKPEVTIPNEAAPTELVAEDLTVGDGDTATAGRNVEVHYVGASWSNGQQFDASWDRGDTFEFRLGGGQVIAGWDPQQVEQALAWANAVSGDAGGIAPDRPSFLS